MSLSLSPFFLWATLFAFQKDDYDSDRSYEDFKHHSTSPL
jgi:hypothetical protein